MATYIVLRPWTFEAAAWFGLATKPSWLMVGADFPEWVRFNLPDALWLYGFLVSLSATWIGPSGRLVSEGWPWIVGAALIALGHETGQALGLVQGTFDIFDLGAYVLAISAAIFTVHRHKETFA